MVVLIREHGEPAMNRVKISRPEHLFDAGNPGDRQAGLYYHRTNVRWLWAERCGINRPMILNSDQPQRAGRICRPPLSWHLIAHA
jgi:hypothetical protein